MTTATCELVSPWFICEERGVVEVKGKGPMQTWYLIGRRD
jgi:adenylate cyclase